MNQAVLERRNEMLKKQIQKMLIRKNQYGISRQSNQFLQQMIKEMYQTSHELNAIR